MEEIYGWMPLLTLKLSNIAYALPKAIAKVSGQAEASVTYFVCIFLSFIACLFVGQIRTTPLRKAFSTGLGFGLGFYNYGLLFLINVASILVCYLLIRLNTRVNGANLVTWWGAIFMISVSFHHHHIARESGTLSLDLICMMNFVKIHMFAVNYENAGKLDDPIKSLSLTPREKHFA